jgi:hypothetical protein
MKLTAIILTLVGLALATTTKEDLERRACPTGVDGALTAGVAAVRNFLKLFPLPRILTRHSRLEKQRLERRLVARWSCQFS